MPHVTDFHATPDHDRHDLPLVAALAAGDLAGHDRDLALDLTRSCASCAELHDDLVAIARATASVPPPITARPRDFQLTPADAARLRPGGLRAILGALSGVRATAARPLGVGLATLGLVGLLIGNVPVQFAASGPSQTSGGGAAPAYDSATEAGPKAAASGAPAYVSVPGAEASAAASSAAGAIDPSRGGAGAPAPSTLDLGAVPAASGGGRTVQSGSADQAGGSPSRDVTAPAVPQSAATTGADSPLRPLNLLFGAVVVAGLGLLVLSRRSGRARA